MYRVSLRDTRQDASEVNKNKTLGPGALVRGFHSRSSRLTRQSLGDRATGGKPASTASSTTFLEPVRLPPDERCVQVCRGLSQGLNGWGARRFCGAMDRAVSVQLRDSPPHRARPAAWISGPERCGAGRSSGRSCRPRPRRTGDPKAGRWCACSANRAPPTNRAGGHRGRRRYARRSS